MTHSFTGRKRIRKSFGHIPEVTTMPNLIEVQRTSYENFLQMNVRPEERARPWEDLASEDAAVAFRAVCRLVAAPAGAVPLLRERLRPAPPVEEGRVRQWLEERAPPGVAAFLRDGHQPIPVACGGEGEVVDDRDLVTGGTAWTSPGRSRLGLRHRRGEFRCARSPPVA